MIRDNTRQGYWVPCSQKDCECAKFVEDKVLQQTTSPVRWYCDSHQVTPLAPVEELHPNGNSLQDAHAWIDKIRSEGGQAIIALAISKADERTAYHWDSWGNTSRADAYYLMALYQHQQLAFDLGDIDDD